MRQPDAKDKPREGFAAAKVPAEIELYDRPTADGPSAISRQVGRSGTVLICSTVPIRSARAQHFRLNETQPFKEIHG
jgi:hypothetical protein